MVACILYRAYGLLTLSGSCVKWEEVMCEMGQCTLTLHVKYVLTRLRVDVGPWLMSCMTYVFLNGTLGLSGLQTSQQSALGGGLFNRGAGQMGGLGTGLGKNELEFCSVYSGTLLEQFAYVLL